MDYLIILSLVFFNMPIGSKLHLETKGSVDKGFETKGTLGENQVFLSTKQQKGMRGLTSKKTQGKIGDKELTLTVSTNTFGRTIEGQFGEKKISWKTEGSHNLKVGSGHIGEKKINTKVNVTLNLDKTSTHTMKGKIGGKDVGYEVFITTPRDSTTTGQVGEKYFNLATITKRNYEKIEGEIADKPGVIKFFESLFN